MRRGWRVGLLVALLMGLLARPVEAQGSWARLGPAGPQAVVAVAVSPSWPADPLLLAARQDGEAGQPARFDLVRSSDGGTTWELLPAPADQISSLLLAPSEQLGRVAFALAGSPGYSGPKRLLRSVDAGSSWQEVLTLTAERLRLTLSPDFGRDGLALVVADGTLFRSGDGGVSWQALDPARGQRVQQVAFSPAFAADRTIFLAATSADFVERPSEQADYELSLGVLVSKDGGGSWSALPGPTVDGVPYRQVASVFVSPTYAEDGTLFAFAWGPWTFVPYLDSSIPKVQSGLFKSSDRGTSWSLIRSGGRSGNLALSPHFADDGVALLAVGDHFISPASYTCTVLRSVDGGANWRRARESGSYESCGEVRLLSVGGGLVGLSQKLGGGSGGWVRSPDGGQTWGPLAPPDGSGQRSLTPSPDFERDRTLFVGAGWGGIWAEGPAVRPTDGRLACRAPLSGGFLRVWQTEEWAWSRLGCPLEAEQQAQIRERTYQERGFDVRAFWPEDDGPTWFKLLQSQYSMLWSAEPKAAGPWPAEPDQVLDGALQPFEGGFMLWLSHPAGQRTIVVLARPGRSWRELSD